jgi:DNA-binding FrmR family transcriptional regulator
MVKEKVENEARKRLRRIAGQVNGLQKMVDDGRYCVDVLTQISALRAALDQLGLLMVTYHLETCVYSRQEDVDHEFGTPEERLEEVRITLNRFLK